MTWYTFADPGRRATLRELKLAQKAKRVETPKVADSDRLEKLILPAPIKHGRRAR